MDPVEVIEVEEARIGCDGGKGALGHPLVYMTMDKDGKTECPYCGRHFVLKKGAAKAAH